jgi:SpoVK/Ycf46/Vps4 family AAA+-type ATPase
LRSKDVVKLWMMRILVRFDAGKVILGGRLHYAGERAAIFRRLGIRHLENKNGDKVSDERLLERLSLTLVAMESDSKRYVWSKTIKANIRLMGELFPMSPAEQTVLVLAAMLRADDKLFDIASHGKSQANVIAQIRGATGLSIDEVRDALSPQGTLSRSKLIEVSSGGSLNDNLKLRRKHFRCVVTGRLRSMDQLFGGILEPVQGATLTPQDYSHLKPGFHFILGVVAEALRTGRRGVNILLYGPPGTGKTELTRVVAKVLSTPLYDVSFMDEEGAPLDSHARISNAYAAQGLLKGRKALLAFDAIESIFPGGGLFFGKPTLAEQSNVWVNDLLEQCQTPMFWVANSIGRMDPAFVRRFDVVVEMKSPPLPRRIEMLKAQCGSMLDAGQVRRIAELETITPALVTRAAGVVRRTKVSQCDQSNVLEVLLNNAMAAQGPKTLRSVGCNRPSDGYDPALCHASSDLEVLAKGVVASRIGRICLYGPPGTGKTAFGYWLADQLGMPLILKRASDIQSPYLGVMEQKLAEAFESASRDGAVLQIDEVDTFLRDRRDAKQRWEISQVNEFLTQLETYEGVLIASTNLMGGLDPAALRRFDYKVEMGYLLPHQAYAMLLGLLARLDLAAELDPSVRQQLLVLQTLTPGDFAVIERQHRIAPFDCVDQVLQSLAAEVTGKMPPEPRRMGFI